MSTTSRTAFGAMGRDDLLCALEMIATKSADGKTFPLAISFWNQAA